MSGNGMLYPRQFIATHWFPTRRSSWLSEIVHHGLNGIVITVRVWKNLQHYLLTWHIRAHLSQPSYPWRGQNLNQADNINFRRYRGQILSHEIVWLYYYYINIGIQRPEYPIWWVQKLSNCLRINSCVEDSCSNTRLLLPSRYTEFDKVPCRVYYVPFDTAWDTGPPGGCTLGIICWPKSTWLINVVDVEFDWELWVI